MWKAKLKDKSEVSELTSKWDDVKDNIEELLLITPKGQIIYLPKNMGKYIQFKSASSEMGRNNIEIESRCVGFEVGGKIVKIRVNEKTNNITVEVE